MKIPRFLTALSLLGPTALAACGGAGSTQSGAANDTAARVYGVAGRSDDQNTLTSEERADGWQLLFDGQTTAGWRRAYADSFPAQGWKVEDGQLIVMASDGSEGGRGGDIVTENEYDNFELMFDFKLTEGANSGVKYFVAEAGDQPPGSAYGLEFQLLDDERHPDAKLGRDGNRTVGSLYDLMPAQNKTVRPIGSWNHGRLRVSQGQVTHWLNGQQVLGYERGSEAFRRLVAESKYAAPEYNAYGRFGEAERGHILLQDHGNQVAFRNLKIRPLSPDAP